MLNMSNMDFSIVRQSEYLTNDDNFDHANHIYMCTPS